LQPWARLLPETKSDRRPGGFFLPVAPHSNATDRREAVFLCLSIIRSITMNKPIPPTFLRCVDVMRRTGLSKSAVYSLAVHGKLPKPAKLAGTRSLRWIEHEIDEWIRQQVDGRLDTHETV
jgi:prophage regulatory protein